jgi:hypothetical protein
MRRTPALILVAILSATACTRATPSSSPSTSGGPESTSTTAPTPAQVAGPLPAVATDPRWLDLGESASPYIGGLDLVSARYVVSHTTRESDFVVRRRADNAVVLRYHTADEDFSPLFVDIAGDVLVVVEATYEGEPDRTFFIDLRTGKRFAVRSLPARGDVFWRNSVTDDGRFYYRSKDCVVMVNLPKRTVSTVRCPSDGSTELVGQNLGASEDGAAWVRADGPGDGACGTGSGVRGARPVAVGPADRCAMNVATLVGGAPVWTEASPDTDDSVWAIDAGRPVALGPADPFTFTMCGAYAYWRTQAGDAIQLRRWRPGLERVEIAYAARSGGEGGPVDQLVLGGCADNILTLQAFGTKPRVRVLALRSTL